MRRTMSLKSRRELLASIRPRYRQASRQEKRQILNELVAATGYHRKHAIHLLSQPGSDYSPPQPQRKGRRRVYTAEVAEALEVVWKAASQICSKRLVPFLPELVETLERHGHLVLSAEIKKKLLGISPATVDRLLAGVRRAGASTGRRGSKRTSFLKQQVPIRTFSEWEGAQPGYLEADLVAHCGGDVSGSYLHTLVLTDVVSGWTECLALLFRDQQLVLQAVRQARAQLPVPLLALDTDNGSEFLNSVLFGYCQQEEIIFTRSRPYKKNDQCFVEQKNGVIVRQFIGYERFEGLEPCRILAQLYGQLRLYINFFQPSMKLLTKKRIGSRVKKSYDLAQTPYQRLQAAAGVPLAVKERLKAQFIALDPVQLLTDIRSRQDALWSYAYVERTTSLPAPLSNNGAWSHSEPTVILEEGSDQAGRGDNGAAASHNDHSPIRPPTLEADETDERRYRHSKRQRRPYQGPRWWRTRKDPFAEVWSEAERQLAQTPDLTAKALFERLQQRYPDQFDDKRLRTFQRRVRAWRMRYILQQDEQPEPPKQALSV